MTGLLPMSGRVDPELRNRPVSNPYPSDMSTRVLPQDLLQQRAKKELPPVSFTGYGSPWAGGLLKGDLKLEDLQQNPELEDYVRTLLAYSLSWPQDLAQIASDAGTYLADQLYTHPVPGGWSKPTTETPSPRVPLTGEEIQSKFAEKGLLPGTGESSLPGAFSSFVGPMNKALQGVGLVGIGIGTLVNARKIKGVTALGKDIASKVKKADQLAKQGKTPQEIEEATGLIQLPSGDIVYNVSDKGMELVEKGVKSGEVVAVPSPIQGYGRGGVRKLYKSRLGDQIKHRELDRLAPEYKDLTIILQPSGSVKGSYSKEGVIRLSKTHSEVVKNDLELRIADNQKEVKDINKALKKEKTSSDGLVVVTGQGRVTPEVARNTKKSLQENTKQAKKDLKTIKETGQVPDGYKERHELSLEQAKSTATHELTHHQQHIGGFEGGANPLKMSPILDVIKRDLDRIPELGDWIKVSRFAKEAINDTPELSLPANKGSLEREVLTRYSNAKAAANPHGMGGLPRSGVMSGYFVAVQEDPATGKLWLPNTSQFEQELAGIEYRLNNPDVKKVIQVSGINMPRSARDAEFNLYQGVEGEATARGVQRLYELETGMLDPSDYADPGMWSVTHQRPYFQSLLDEVEAPRGTITHGEIKKAADVYGVSYLGGTDSALSVGPKTIAQRRAEAIKELPRVGGGKSKGQYIGAPQGMNRPGLLNEMMDNYLNQMREGAGGRKWYEEAGEEILNVAGGTPRSFFPNPEAETRARQFTSALGITSPEMKVDPNLGHAIRAHNQMMVGEPPYGGKYPNKNRPEIEGVYEGTVGSLGMKRDPFVQQLARGGGFDPDPASAKRAVHDIWDARAHGYGKEFSAGLSEAQHRFLDQVDDIMIAEANRRGIGGFSSWTTGRAQAAVWIAQKAQTEGTPVSEAARHYGDFLEKYTAQLSYESMPGGTTGHLPELRSAKPQIQQDYHDKVNELLLDSEGRDKLAMAQGLLTRQSVHGPGYYAGTISPGTSARVLAGRAPGDTGIVDPSSQRLMEAVEGSRGLLLGQDMIAFNLPGNPGEALKNANTWVIDYGRPINEGELVQLMDKLQKKYGPDVYDDFAPVPSVNGVRLLFVGDKGMRGFEGARGSEKAAQETSKMVKKLAKELKPGKELPVAFHKNIVGGQNAMLPYGYETNAWTLMGHQQFGQGYVPLFDDPNNKVFKENFNKVAPDIAAGLRRLDESMKKKEGWTLGKNIQQVREAIARNGVDGLNYLIKNGVVPPTVIGLLGIGLTQKEREDAGLVSPLKDQGS